MALLGVVLSVGLGLAVGQAASPAADAASSSPDVHPIPPTLPTLAGPEGLDLTWAQSQAWFDGKAELATYQASRSIYGAPRSYTARFFTNAEDFDPATGTKANREGPSTMLVFKHHHREDIPTPNYDYHYSTMSYVGRDDMSATKVDMGSQEDCGATFKQYRVADDTLYWRQFSYFPDQGARAGTAQASPGLVFHDALPLVLRGYPFKAPRELSLQVVPDATTTKWSPAEPINATAVGLGIDTLELPIGKVEAFGVEVRYADATREQYWFEVDDARQHVMVKAQTVNATYALTSWRRWAYWELP